LSRRLCFDNNVTTLHNTHTISSVGKARFSKADPLLIMTSGLAMVIKEKDRCNDLTFSKWSMSVIRFDIFIAQPAS